jgi:hypothetical protein
MLDPCTLTESTDTVGLRRVNPPFSNSFSPVKLQDLDSNANAIIKKFSAKIIK